MVSRKKTNIISETSSLAVNKAKCISILEDGKLLLVDLKSGEVVATSDEKVAIRQTNKFIYSLEARDMILEQLSSGRTLSEVGSMEGYPSYATLLRWRLDHPDFDEKINKIRQMLAERFHDEALREATSDMDCETEAGTMKQKQMKIDTLKWAAERNDPAKFGGSTKLLGDKNNPIGMYVLNTGIDRGESLAPIEGDKG